jgi:hypothetical protein
LRQAIIDAASGDTISFGLRFPATITLTSGQLTIAKNLTINGPGASLLTVSGNNSSRVLLINGIFTVTISGLTIANGAAGMSVDNGAGIFNFRGILSLVNCVLSGNTASADGGAIANEIDGMVTLNNCVVSGNTAGVDGGGIFNSATMNVMGSTISGNRAIANAGGGINNDIGTISVSNSSISGNQAVGGGAIWTDFGTVNLSNSTVSGNSSVSEGGGIGSVMGLVNVTNSTFSGNSTGTPGNAEEGGGAIFSDGTTHLVNSTISGNSAGVANGGGVLNSTGNATTVLNTIIAGNTAASGPDISGTFSSAGHNLIGSTTGGVFPPASGDQLGANPMLGPVANNGGPTQTQALLAGSPAIDAGDDSVLGSPLFLTTDQRGPAFPRKSGSHVDIGAFEVQQFNTCLRDNSTGNLFQWSSTTGAYTFTRCSDGFRLSGTGTTGLVGGIKTLKDFKPDRRISAGFNTGQLTGNATIYLMVAQGVWQSLNIVDTNPAATCQCH